MKTLLLKGKEYWGGKLTDIHGRYVDCSSQFAQTVLGHACCLSVQNGLVFRMVSGVFIFNVQVLIVKIKCPDRLDRRLLYNSNFCHNIIVCVNLL